MTFATDQQLNHDSLSRTSLAVLAIRTAVFDQWECEVRARVEGAAQLLRPILINTMPAFYDNLAESLTPDYPRANATSNTNVAGVHGNERARTTTYSAAQVIHEYQILKEVLYRVASQSGIAFQASESHVIEVSINLAMRDAVREFSHMHEGLRHRLAATLTHDMRTPLSVVLNGSRLIEKTANLDHAQMAARKIRDQAGRLSEMITSLVDALTYDQADHLSLAPSTFDMHALALEIKDQYSDAYTGGFEVIGTSVTGFWDRDLIRRALENLANNAVKYGDGGCVRITVKEYRERMMLGVHNSGIAIPVDMQSRLFDYLRRGPTRGVQGWGIGLPYAKNVAESHGGSIAVDSSKESGTTFVIDIPVDCKPFIRS